MSFAPFVNALAVEQTRILAQAEAVGLSPSDSWNVLVVKQLRAALQLLARKRGFDPGLLEAGRLFRAVPGFVADEREGERQALMRSIELEPLPHPPQPLSAEGFGHFYEALLSARPDAGKRGLRKRTGSYYTPEGLTGLVIERAFEVLERGVGPGWLRERPLRILDPALGAAAFLLRAGRELAARSGRSVREVVEHELFGVDISPLAVAVAEASLWLLADSSELTLAQAGGNLRVGDALCAPSAAHGFGTSGVDFSELGGGSADFQLVVGNPPWVAFAGRATQPLSPPVRDYYRQSFRAFRGYPTLHALFVELAARLAPNGVVALLIPSPLADLDGYRHVRAVLASSHQVEEPLLELGQDAFASVTQPCFALVASPRRDPCPDPERPFVLSERNRATAVASEVAIPGGLSRLAQLPRLPAALFGEMGLQTNAVVSQQLLFRGSAPPPGVSYALLEGRNVAEFRQSLPRLFLKPDRALLAEHRVRLRDVSEYERVKLVVRQTAAITIACAHAGLPFRNSLLAGFELPEFPCSLTLGLLNSTLYRALHLAARRDARQGVFPQVKVAHLRSLPAPPDSQARGLVAELAHRASTTGLTRELRLELDRAVFALFGFDAHESAEITSFVGSRSPLAGLTTPFTD